MLTVSCGRYKLSFTGRYYLQDGMICLAGCDKTIPGVTMALPRLNAVSVHENVMTVL